MDYRLWMTKALDNLIDVAPATIARYQDEGWALVTGLATPEEIAVYRAKITQSTERLAKNYKPLEERDTYGKAFIQNMNLWVDDPEVAEYSLAKRFGKVAADLMGVSSVRIYHDQALYKEPGGGPTPWHQDQQYWPLDGVKCVTMWMPLVDITPDMGTLKFAVGSQSIGYQGPLNISDDSEAQLESLIKDRGFEVVQVGSMKAGDATFHDGWCIHGAPGNGSTTTTREVMTVIFFDADAVISEPDSPQRELDLSTWFPGLKGGDPAASKLNPVVYP